MERKAVVYITLTAVFAILVTTVSLGFILPFLRYGEIPLFSALPSFGASASDASPEQAEAEEAALAAAAAAEAERLAAQETERAAAAAAEAERLAAEEAERAAGYDEALSLL